MRSDGSIVRVHNERADRTKLDNAIAEVTRWEAVIADLEAQAAGLDDLDTEWRAHRSDYAATMEQLLRLEVEGARREIGFLAQRLSLVCTLAQRKEALARKGNAAPVRCRRGQC